MSNEEVPIATTFNFNNIEFIDGEFKSDNSLGYEVTDNIFLYKQPNYKDPSLKIVD